MDVESIAVRIAGMLQEALASRENAAVAVSSSPAVLAVLGALASTGLPWQRIRFVMVDEIAGPPSDPRSRYRLLYDAFFSRIGFLPGRALRYWSEGDPPETVAGYYGTMASEIFEIPEGEIPRFDLALLELAPDGSVGSFVRGSPALEAGTPFAVPVTVDGELRYTLAGGTIRRARRVVVLGAEGTEGSPVVAKLRPDDGELVWLPTAETGPAGAASHA